MDDRMRAAFRVTGRDASKSAPNGGSRGDEERPLLVDLGCGPGLYATEFAARGWSVHGIDFSPASVAYARKHKADHARYELADFTRCAYPRADGAILVYGIFGNLSERDRDRMLSRVRKSLAPGALFIFDTFTEPFAHREGGTETWYSAAKDGFWLRESHVVLERSHLYAHKRTVLKCYHLLSAGRGFETRTVRFRWYDRVELTEVLERNGFEVVDFAGSLTGEPYKSEGDWIAVCARVRG